MLIVGSLYKLLTDATDFFQPEEMPLYMHRGDIVLLIDIVDYGFRKITGEWQPRQYYVFCYPADGYEQVKYPVYWMQDDEFEKIC